MRFIIFILKLFLHCFYDTQQELAESHALSFLALIITVSPCSGVLLTYVVEL